MCCHSLFDTLTNEWFNLGVPPRNVRVCHHRVVFVKCSQGVHSLDSAQGVIHCEMVFIHATTIVMIDPPIALFGSPLRGSACTLCWGRTTLTATNTDLQISELFNFTVFDRNQTSGCPLKPRSVAYRVGR